MIKRLCFYDFDSTLIHSPQPEEGKLRWEEIKGIKYPHVGWWSKPENLDLDVFPVEPILPIVDLIKEDISDPSAYVIILTSRLIKLKDEVKTCLDNIGIFPDRYDLKKNNKGKGERVLEYLDEFSDIEQIDVYDDNYEREIISYKSIIDLIPENIKFNIYYVKDEDVNLINENKLLKIIKEEINKIF
jgi:hypothetical protein